MSFLFQSGSNNKYVPATQIFYDPTHKQLTMHIRMERVGCYQAVVSYGDSKLKNGEFNILVISGKWRFSQEICVIAINNNISMAFAQ